MFIIRRMRKLTRSGNPTGASDTKRRHAGSSSPSWCSLRAISTKAAFNNFCHSMYIAFLSISSWATEGFVFWKKSASISDVPTSLYHGKRTAHMLPRIPCVPCFRNRGSRRDFLTWLTYAYSVLSTRTEVNIPLTFLRFSFHSHAYIAVVSLREHQ